MGLSLPARNLPWPILWVGVELIAQAEGCRLTAYQDISGVWTIGWGQTGPDIKAGMKWTQQEADRRFCQTLTEVSDAVSDLVSPEPIDMREHSALVSLAYNIGIDAFSRSSVLAAHNRGDKPAAAAAFALWNKATINGKKQVVQGLVTRRAKEAELYASATGRVSGAGLSPDAAKVEPLAKSPTIVSGAASVATGVLAVASEVSPQVGTVARALQVNVGLVLAIIAIVTGAVVLYRRYQQRRQGVA